MIEEFELIQCRRCEEEKLTEEFAPRTRICKKCRKIEYKTYRRERMLGRSYGLSVTDYNRMLNRQFGVCAICKKLERPLHVDHDKRTGAVRGLLCRGCNTGLGCFGDNPGFLQEAMEYLTLGPRLRDFLPDAELEPYENPEDLP